MKTRRQTNFVWGVVSLALALVLVARALNLIPDGIFDLITRAWPLLLVLTGLGIFLRSRIPLGGFIALLLSAALAAGVTVYAFSSRAEQQRSDYQTEFSQPIEGSITLLRVRLQTLATDVELVRSLDDTAISGEFVGSSESTVQVNYIEAGDGTAEFTLSEQQLNQFPMLAAIGRGMLRVELPAEIPMDIEFEGTNGSANINGRDLWLERLNINLRRGDALVTLPAYDPQASPDDATLGAWAVTSGDITVRVPDTIAARLELDRGLSGIPPQYDPSLYNLLANGTLEARNFDAAEIKVRYNITAPGGAIRLEVVPE
jgi:hypothetical protein